MTNLEQALIDSGQAENEKEANELVRCMLNRVNNFEDATEVLEFYGLDDEFDEEDIKEWKQYNPNRSEKRDGANWDEDGANQTPIPQKTEAETDKIAYKIKMLIDKANSTDSQSEKDLCMMKAQELIQKYSIESSRIFGEHGNKIKGEENIIEEHVKYDEEWDRNLMKNVAKGNMCKIIFCTGDSEIYIIGKESNVNAVCSLIGFYKKAILNLAIESAKKKTRLAKTVALATGKGKIGTRELSVIEKAEKENVKDYLLGAVDGLEDALNRKNEEFTGKIFQVEQEDGSVSQVKGGEVMRINVDRIEEYIRKKYPRLGHARFGSGGGNQNSSAYGRGHADGSGLGSGVRRLN